ncbi:MAG: penicillin-binding protein 2 [Desulfobacterales bacterium]
MRKYFKIPDIDWYKQRLILTMYVMIAVFLVLFIRLLYLQMIKGQEFRRLSENNCIRLQSITPARGLIFDRSGNLLVDNRPSFDLYITVKDAGPLDEIAMKLAEYAGIPCDMLLKTIAEKKASPYKPICILRDMSRDTLAKIEVHRYELPGISVAVRPVRQYIYGKRAAHLIGYLGEISSEELASGHYPGTKGGDYIGKYGVEKKFETYLRGNPGGRQVEVNASGQVLRVLKTVPADPGCNLYLTIDERLQKTAEILLAGKAGAAIAMDPDNGEILAMASSPTFDQNAFVSGMSPEEWNALISNSDRPMENKTIQAEYPPASTYKMITAMAALEEGVIDRNTVIHCSGRYVFGNRVFRDWKLSGHGPMNVCNALAQSCDVFFYQVGLKLGVDRLASYAVNCGLGNATGIELGHESRGLVPTSTWKKQRIGSAWQPGETLSIAIGQGYNLTTPLQVLVLTSAIANGGKKYRPQIVKRIETEDGLLVREAVTEITGTLPASNGTLESLKKGMLMVVDRPFGTAYGAKLENIRMSGKTGTAQIVGRSAEKNGKTPKHLLPHAWFAAYAPSEDPAIAVVVLIEHGEHGSSAAAPVASQLIQCHLTGDYEIEPPEPASTDQVAETGNEMVQ